MTNLKFVVEGPADLKFIADYVNLLTAGNVYLTKENFIVVGSNINTFIVADDKQKQVQIHNGKGGKVLVIMDADKTFAEFCDKLNTLRASGLDFEYFLFPNHSDEGNLENLLLQIINPEHQSLVDCYGSYQDCIEKTQRGYIVPDNKSKVYVYLRTLLNSFKKGYINSREKDEANEQNRDYQNTEHWTLDNQPVLEPLKAFLKKHIN